jgi:hypothetical protein
MQKSIYSLAALQTVLKAAKWRTSDCRVLSQDALEVFPGAEPV